MSISAWLHLTPAERRRRKKRRDRDTESIIYHRPLSFSLHFCHLLNSFQLDALCLYKLVRLAWTDTRPAQRQWIHINCVMKLHSEFKLHLELLQTTTNIYFHMLYCGTWRLTWLCGVCSHPMQVTQRRHLGSRTHLWAQTAKMEPTLIYNMYVNLSSLTPVPL